MLPYIYEYLDYRQYLVDVVTVLKKSDPLISMRSFGKIAGSSSPNFLQLVRDRKLNIQVSAIESITSFLDLGKKEGEYFLNLVNFDQAKTYNEKDFHFQKILKTREYRQIKILIKEQYQFFSHWYIPVIRELITRPEYPGDTEWIVKKIEPPVPEGKVRKGIELLKKLGLIKEVSGTNLWKMTQKVISTPSEVLSVALKKYHDSVINLARESIERFPKPQRDIRSVTVGLSLEGFKEVKSRMEAFWKEILAYAEKDQGASRVYQVNTQLFPLSKKERKNG